MNFRREWNELGVTTRFVKRTIFLCLLLFFFFSVNSYSQDSIALPKDLNEEKELKFQHYFFKALSEKSIRNFQKAIESLESCNQILPNDIAVFFEFSKNYFELNQLQLAKEYIDRALLKAPKNNWMLQHLVAVLQKSNRYAEAIEVQLIIIEQLPNNNGLNENLIRLYLRNDQPEKALEFVNFLTDKTGATPYLKNLKTTLEKRKEVQPIKEVSSIAKFKLDKTYSSLENLLKTSKSKLVLLQYSLEGIQLFPAQPYVYLVQGTVLNYQKSYEKALSVLRSGIDFVFEDAMEQAFYIEIAKSYKGLGDLKGEEKYLKKINKD